MKGKDFLWLADLESEEIGQMVRKARTMKEGSTPQVMDGKVAVLLFEKPSLRTRVSFEVGIKQMGGDCIYLSGSDIGLGTREPSEDVARGARQTGGRDCRQSLLASQSGDTCRVLYYTGSERPVRLGTPMPGSWRPSKHERAQGRPDRVERSICRGWEQHRVESGNRLRIGWCQLQDRVATRLQSSGLVLERCRATIV